MELKIPNHIEKRYVERIKNIEFGSDNELKQYLVTNSEQIKKDILKIYEFSELFYEGVIGTEKKYSKFYINNDIILVISRNGLDLITLYHPNFGFGDDINGNNIDRELSKKLLEKIKFLKEEKEKLTVENETKIKDSESEIEQTKELIKLTQQQLNQLNEDLKYKQLVLKNINNNIAIVETEYVKTCTQLINYGLYKKACEET